MITHIFGYFSLLLFFITIVLYCQKVLKWSIFKIIPRLTFIYFGGMIGISLYIWQLDKKIVSFIKASKDYLFTMMLFFITSKK